jgi:hypothetical protein
VLIHSSNLKPLVTAIRSGSKPILSYLTRFGTVSVSFLVAQFLLRVASKARTLPEELVNAASCPEVALRIQRGQDNHPALAFPQSPGIILETFHGNLLTSISRLSSFNELTKSYHGLAGQQRIVIHTLIDKNFALQFLVKINFTNKSRAFR